LKEKPESSVQRVSAAESNDTGEFQHGEPAGSRNWAQDGRLTETRLQLARKSGDQHPRRVVRARLKQPSVAQSPKSLLDCFRSDTVLGSEVAAPFLDVEKE
jgi:hypothetical protein